MLFKEQFLWIIDEGMGSFDSQVLFLINYFVKCIIDLLVTLVIFGIILIILEFCFKYMHCSHTNSGFFSLSL